MAFLGWRSLGAGDLDAAVDAYQKAGLPWVAADMARNPPVKDSENAEPLLHQAIHAFGDGFSSDSDALLKAARDGDTVQFNSLIKPYEHAMRLASIAARKPKLDWRRDWDDGQNLHFKELPPLKGIGKAFAFRAQSRAASGNVGGAIADLATAQALADLTGQDPVLISTLVQISMRLVDINAAQHIAVKWVSDEKGLEALDRWFSARWPAIDFEQPMKGEEFMSVSFCRNLDQYGLKALDPANRDLSNIPPAL